MRAGGWVTGLVSAALASVALIPADALTASVPSGFHISVLAHVPGAREMAPCGNFLYVGTAGSRVYSVALNGGRVDPDTMYTRYFTSTGNLNKVAGYASPKLDALFAQGRATSNVTQRHAIYTQISKTLEGQGVWVWMFTANDYYAISSKVQNFVPMPNESLQYLRQTTLG